MKQLFVDTSAFAALFMSDDPDHEDVKAVFQDANRKRRGIVTTNAVVFETYVLLLHRARRGRDDALRFLDLIEQEVLTVARLTAQDEIAAIKLIRVHKDKSYSLCDASSFVVMERMHIKHAVSLDEDFQSYGRFQILP